MLLVFFTETKSSPLRSFILYAKATLDKKKKIGCGSSVNFLFICSFDNFGFCIMSLQFLRHSFVHVAYKLLVCLFLANDYCYI